MLKFQPTENAILWQEVPTEISLGISLTSCQFRCKGCHSAHLREDTGIELTDEIIDLLMVKNKRISCVCILGEGNDSDRLYEVLHRIHVHHKKKTCLYTANVVKNCKDYLPVLDYIKTGPYVEKLGALDSPTTNQRMYKILDGVIEEDITSAFRKSI